MDSPSWCETTKRKYEIDTDHYTSWGSAPENIISDFNKKLCKIYFRSKSNSINAISKCPNNNLNSSLPIIAVMSASTARNIDTPTIQNIALFVVLLPSLVQSLDCGFRYHMIVGYDIGDPFYDKSDNIDLVADWFEQYIQKPLYNNHILISLHMVAVTNPQKKPGPVFNEMARYAYKHDADYFYRVNDDTEFVGYWAKAYVHTLQHILSPYGVIGPACMGAGNRILTHDFVHRTHMEIFEMNYYPPPLSDWYMDDWMTQVYGPHRTFISTGIQVQHHTTFHGQRYKVDRSHKNMLLYLVKEGREKIIKWMLRHDIADEILRQVDLNVRPINLRKQVPIQPMPVIPLKSLELVASS